MTIQSLVLLHRLIRVQKNEHGSIWMDEENRKICTVIEQGQKPLCINLSKIWLSVRPRMSYLMSKGLLEQTGSSHYSLTHSGFHYFQTLAASALSFLVKSVAVPIVVAFLTALITTVITTSLLK